MNAIILKISPLVFGIYLFHEHKWIKMLLWTKLFVPYRQLGSWEIFALLYASVVLIFGVGCIVEKGRMILFQQIAKLKIVGKMNQKIEKIEQKIQLDP